MAANEFAIACSVSLCVWIPMRSPGIPLSITAFVAENTCDGNAPPFVSHKTIHLAPAS